MTQETRKIPEPGSWEANEFYQLRPNHGCSYVESDSGTIAQTFGSNYVANAYLVAAAPDMYFALTEIETHLDGLAVLLRTHQDMKGNPDDSSYVLHEIGALESASKLIRAAIALAKTGARP